MLGYIERLNAEFQWFTVLYGIKCCFLVIITYQCVIVNKKMHKIPYHRVNHWDEACSPFCPVKVFVCTK